MFRVSISFAEDNWLKVTCDVIIFMTVNVALSVKATRVGEHKLYDTVLVLCYALLLPVATAGTFYIKCRRVAKAGDDEDGDEHNDAADDTLLARATKMYINGTATERHRAILLEFLRHKADEAAMQRQRWKVRTTCARARASPGAAFSTCAVALVVQDFGEAPWVFCSSPEYSVSREPVMEWIQALCKKYPWRFKHVRQNLQT